MNILVIGWYGTETLGDRAILDGIIKVFDDIEVCEFVLGSLYPFFSERTLYEENYFLLDSEKSHVIRIIDLKEKKSVDEAICEADMVIMGGGPLMDLPELAIIKYCFMKARKKGKKTVIFGCGVGPISDSYSITSLESIVNNSDLVILRDTRSLIRLKQLKIVHDRITVLGDPAVISIEEYKKRQETDRSDDAYLAVNFRNIENMEYGECKRFSIEKCRILLEKASRNLKTIKLVPMHTFFIGGDDREYLNRIIVGCDFSKIAEIVTPRNLDELYTVFYYATACIGMRYHSVVMQTILNGNNYIVDYNRKAGQKTIGFLEENNLVNRYSGRVWDINDELDSQLVDFFGDKIIWHYSSIKKDYIKEIQVLINEGER